MVSRPISRRIGAHADLYVYFFQVVSSEYSYVKLQTSKASLVFRPLQILLPFLVSHRDGVCLSFCFFACRDVLRCFPSVELRLDGSRE